MYVRSESEDVNPASHRIAGANCNHEQQHQAEPGTPRVESRTEQRARNNIKNQAQSQEYPDAGTNGRNVSTNALEKKREKKDVN